VQQVDLEFTYVILLYGKCRILNMCAGYTTAVFCSSFISCFPGMLLRYVLNNSEMAPVAPIIIFIIIIIIILLYYNDSYNEGEEREVPLSQLQWVMCKGQLSVLT
jgi:hypothetical protein